MSKMEIDARGNKYWNSKGHLHREDGPAIEKYHVKSWYVNGKCHRVDGPAIEYTNGFKCWFINGRQYSFDEWLDKLQISDEEKIMLCLKWK